MKSIMQLMLIGLFLLYQGVNAQNQSPQNGTQKEFNNIKDALKNPEQVVFLNLSNQTEILPNTIWEKFINLEYLSLKNDHLQQIPIEIANLRKLRVLDLSGNDFKTLPIEFIQLQNLEELYLNDEKNMNLPKTIEILSKLPKLKSLHLENDQLATLPNNMKKLEHLESLYLNQNQFMEIPKQIEGLKHLQYLDLNDNQIKPELQDVKNLNFGFEIKF